MAHTREAQAAKIVRWFTKIAIIGIFTVVGWLPKFTGNAGPLVEKLDGFGGQTAVYGIAAAEAIAIVLLLIPKTAFFGAVLAIVLMIGAIGSHVAGPVGIEGDFLGVFVAAIIAFVAAGVNAFLEWKRTAGSAAPIAT
ncbi:MAG: hypothetical protein AAGK04_11170 [Planctomycetota bacterium]